MWFSRRRSSRCNAAHPIVRACVETLESRRLLSTAVWTGAAGDGSFSDAGNWQGDVAPTSGEDLDFPAAVTNTAVVIGSDVTVGNVEFDAGYTLSSFGTITLDGNLTASAGTTTVANSIVLGQSTTALVNPTANLELNGVISGTGFGITQQGNGTLTLGGSGDTYTGETTVSGGTIVGLTSLASAVNVTAYSTFDDNGTVASLSGYGATYAPVNGAAAGTITITNGFTLSANTGNTLAFDIGGPNASSSFVVNAGTVTLDNAILDATALNTYTPTQGDVITLITNNTGTPVVGTFNGLAQGAKITIGGESYQISYDGGGSGDNVTLTALAAQATVTVVAKKTPIFEGDDETFTATVTGAQSAAPTGTVTFYSNEVALKDVTTGDKAITVVNGKAAVTTDFLAAGNDNITAVYSGGGEYAATTSAAINVNVRTGADPVIETATHVASTHGYTISATVEALDETVQPLIYDWTTIHTPSGGKNAVFSTNDNNAASTIIARFSKDGGYILQCRVTNVDNNSVYTDVYVTVSQKVTTFRIEPHNAKIPVNGTEQYAAVVLDQFGHPMRTGQDPTYAVTAGPGEISSTGLFSATDVTGEVTIEVLDDNLTGTVGADVIS